MEDSNPQETIADLYVGFLDRCLTVRLIFRIACLHPGKRHQRQAGIEPAFILLFFIFPGSLFKTTPPLFPLPPGGSLSSDGLHDPAPHAARAGGSMTSGQPALIAHSLLHTL